MRYHFRFKGVVIMIHKCMRCGKSTLVDLPCRHCASVAHRLALKNRGKKEREKRLLRTAINNNSAIHACILLGYDPKIDGFVVLTRRDERVKFAAGDLYIYRRKDEKLNVVD